MIPDGRAWQTDRGDQYLVGADWRGRRVHQVRLGGGDTSCDSYCYRS